MRNDARLAALAWMELVGKPISTDTLDEMNSLLDLTGNIRVSIELAAMFRSYLEAQGIPVQPWIDEYRRQELRDECDTPPPGLA